VRCGETRPKASQARKAEEEMPTRRATSLMRNVRGGLRAADVSDKFFLLDTGPGLL
jgi:hypothetical protein